MNRICLFAILLVFASSSFAYAQAKAREVSGGVELGFPNDALEDAVVFAVGLSARYEKGFSRKTSWLSEAGVILFTGKNGGGPIISVPVQGGIKYYFKGGMKGFYGMAELGIHSFSGDGASGTNFSFAPAVGYHFNKVDIGLKYQTISSSWISASYATCRVAYIFSK
ncbi:MAG TPA: hypothetical protein VKQ08_02195 [Cyclobacteriaceae bacterium]|nr:hypothetical protein [Cyclobacteriaceae bacterium]